MNDNFASDEAIITDILNGNVNRYALLISKYNQRMYRICKSYLRDEAEIEDVMQDSYIKAFQSLPTFAQRSSFGTWLIRIMINEALQRLRSLNKINRISFDAPMSEQEMYTDRNDPENEQLSNELRQIIESGLDALPEIYKVIFVMREIEKMNVAETAQTLDISQANVKVRLNRAKELLRNALLKRYPLHELYEFNLVRCSRIAKNVMERLTPLTFGVQIN
jgi:RNA polymerase sigma-70 factor (ECF subfamily)